MTICVWLRVSRQVKDWTKLQDQEQSHTISKLAANKTPLWTQSRKFQLKKTTP